MTARSAAGPTETIPGLSEQERGLAGVRGLEDPEVELDLHPRLLLVERPGELHVDRHAVAEVLDLGRRGLTTGSPEVVNELVHELGVVYSDLHLPQVRRVDLTLPTLREE
jgi:hypothetical protein